MDNLPEELDFSVLPDVSDLPPNHNLEEQLFAAHMEARWNALRYIFGKTYPEDGVWTRQDPDLLWNWVGGAFVCFPPQRNRNNWYFVTHGLSQPMEDDLTFTRQKPKEMQLICIESGKNIVVRKRD